jgi:hypothetical protein
MSSDPLRRIENDLATLKAAFGTELPYDRSHVAMYFLSAGLGVLLVVLSLSGLESYVRPSLFAYIVVMAGAWAVQIRHLHARRAEAPARWRWGRKELAASLVAMALAVGYVVWTATLARWQGQWGLREALAMASSVCFALGAFGCVWVVADTRRWHLLAGAATLVISGLVMPLCETRDQFYLLLGAMIIIGALSSGLLLLWQIRRHEVGRAN